MVYGIVSLPQGKFIIGFNSSKIAPEIKFKLKVIHYTKTTIANNTTTTLSTYIATTVTDWYYHTATKQNPVHKDQYHHCPPTE